MISGSGRQPNFAALNRGRRLYSAGRPSRWASAHISSSFCFLFVSEIPREPLNGFAQNSQRSRVWSLARRSLNVKVKGQSSRSAGPKDPQNTAHSSPLTMHGKAFAVRRMLQAATDDAIPSPPGVTGRRQCTITAACVQFMLDKTL